MKPSVLRSSGNFNTNLLPGTGVLLRRLRLGLHICRVDWLCLDWCVKLGDMKKQASDQSFHDRRYQERKRAEAAKKPAPKKAVSEETSRTTDATKENSSK
jgi:hypothetical protein